jgi:hypothetical protein
MFLSSAPVVFCLAKKCGIWRQLDLQHTCWIRRFGIPFPGIRELASDFVTLNEYAAAINA